jgi:hypothetical protein
MAIVNDDSRVATKLETSLTDDARVVIYDRHMFIVHTTGKHSYVTGMTSTQKVNKTKELTFLLTNFVTL